MSRGRDSNVACKVYIGDLPRDASEKEIERALGYYGPVRSVWVARNPSGFAFVEFEDPRDAEDAVHDLDGKTICGSRVRVEHSTGKSRQRQWNRGGGGGGGDRRPRGGGARNFSRDDKCYECGESGHYAYDCHRYRRGRRRSSRSRSRSGERRRSYSKSRSRSKSRD